MAELNYASKSISNIATDNIISQIGTVVKNEDGSVSINNNSQCTFGYTYNANDNKLECEGLLVAFRVSSSNATRSTRYNTQVAIDVTIHYLKETFNESGVSQGYEDGSYQFSRVYPSFIHENKGYVGSIEIESGRGLIKTIALTLSFMNGDSDEVITFEYVDIYNSRTVQQTVSDTVGWSAVINGVTVKPNGYALKYDGIAEQTTLLIDIEDIEGTPTLVQIIVNSTKDSEKVITVDADDIPIPRD